MILGEDRVDQEHLRADLVGHDGGQHAHEPDGSDGLGHGAVVAQRAEDEQVGQGAEHGLDAQGEEQRRPEAQARPEVDGRAQPRYGLEQLPVAQERVGVRGVQRLGPGGEVEDPRGAVRDDERHGKSGEDATVAEAQ